MSDPSFYFSHLIQFYMKRKSWALALSSLDDVLAGESGSDDESVCGPDTDSLLLRSEVRLRLGDKAGALEDALTLTDSLREGSENTLDTICKACFSPTDSRSPKAIILKGQV